MKGFGVVGADLQPDVVDILFVGMLHGALCEEAGNAAAAMVGVSGDVGDEVEAMVALFEGHEADVADDVIGFFPDVASERQRGAIRYAVRPLYKGVVFACAAHVLHIAPAVIVHGAGEALFDQVRHGGQVSQYAKWTQVRMMLFSCWDGDACHAGIIDADGGMGNREIEKIWRINRA